MSVVEKNIRIQLWLSLLFLLIFFFIFLLLRGINYNRTRIMVVPGVYCACFFVQSSLFSFFIIFFPLLLFNSSTFNVEWQVMYTTQVTQKAKKYHDGFIRLAIIGSLQRQVDFSHFLFLPEADCLAC